MGFQNDIHLGGAGQARLPPRNASGRSAPFPLLIVLGALTALLGSVPACEPDPPPSDPELREALGLDDRTAIHQVLLSGHGARTRVLPTELDIVAGDVVQFRVMDGRVHRLRFLLDDISPGARAFLDRTRQAVLPPITERDARLVLTFAGAPAGEYPFVVEGSGEPVRGLIRVADS